MIRFFILLLFFVISLGAISNSEILNRADSLMTSENESNQFRAYNDYKNLYLRAVMEDDSALKIQSLQGIVKSGNRLNIDVSVYSQELQELQGLSTKSNYHQPEPKPMKKTKNIENVYVESLHKLISIKWDEDKLLLVFDKQLGSKQIDYSTLHDIGKNKYKYIFDIKTAMLTDSQNINKSEVDKIKLAQYDPNTLRLVIENSADINIAHNINSSTLEITMRTARLEPHKAPEITAKITPSIKEAGKVVVIDAGHGGEDPGAVGYNQYREKEIVFEIAKELEKVLKSRGYKVYMTRDRDAFIKLSDRTKFANEKNADIFVSIHANAVANGSSKEVNGIECYFLSPSRSNRAKKVAALENSADMSDMNMYGKDSFLSTINSHNIVASNKLAIDLQRGMLGLLNQKYKDVRDGGVREGPFWVLVGAQMPSVLVEVGFITNPEEAQRLADEGYRKTLTKGLSDGIQRYFINN